MYAKTRNFPENNVSSVIVVLIISNSSTITRDWEMDVGVALVFNGSNEETFLTVRNTIHAILTKVIMRTTSKHSTTSRTNL